MILHHTWSSHTTKDTTATHFLLHTHHTHPDTRDVPWPRGHVSQVLLVTNVASVTPQQSPSTLNTEQPPPCRGSALHLGSPFNWIFISIQIFFLHLIQIFFSTSVFSAAAGEGQQMAAPGGSWAAPPAPQTQYQDQDMSHVTCGGRHTHQQLHIISNIYACTIQT